jgi:diguanylate cyclase (GGDEF)-like protein
MFLSAVQLTQGIQFVAFALIFGGMLFLSRKDRSLWWLFGNYLLGSLGLVLNLARAHEPAWLSNVAGLEIPLIRYGFLHAALVDFLGGYRSTRWVAVALAVICLPFYILWSGTGYADPAFAARNFAVLDFALAVQTALSAWLLLRSEDTATRLPRIAMSAFLAVYSATETIRLILVFATQRTPLEIAPTIESFSYAIYLIASSATPMAFIWLLNARLLHDLQRQSMLDPLTHLLNRRGLHQVGERELPRSERSGQSLALAVADIDHFKRLNDTYGHAAGDAVLRDIARMLEASVRRGDAVARMGGEEFVILLPDTEAEQAVTLVERLRETIESHAFTVREGTVRITISFGVTVSRGRTGLSLEGLVDEADTSLYAAKQDGRNRTRLHELTGAAASR